MTKKILIFPFILILVFTFTTAVFAEEYPLCSELGFSDQVSGVVVSVDAENNTAVVDTDPESEEGLCVVEFEQDFGHPITTLLGNYFSNFSTEELNTALETTQGAQVCIVPVPESDPIEWQLAELEEGEECPEDGVMADVTGYDSVNGFQLAFNYEDEDQEIDLMFENPELASAFESLNLLLNEDGSLQDVGHEIAEYHDEGYGFGVLVKIYGIAEDCDECDVESLLAMFDENGMGHIFKEYGKPALLGVGHVRHDKTADGEGSSPAANGICNALEKSNGKAKGHSDVDCGGGETESTAVPEADTGKGKDKEKPNNNGKPNKNNKGN